MVVAVASGGVTATASEPLRFGTPRGRWTLAATVLGSGMAALDATVVNVALPRLGRDLDSEFSGLQWVLNGYTLTLASLILVGGSLGDRYGRRRIFLIGVVWFALASLLCGAAPTMGVLVAARLLQGVGGALLTPGSLAILQASFHPQDRARAIGAWSGLGGVMTALGPFLGGWLTEAYSWRLIFLLNLPLAVLVLWVTARHVPESSDPTVEGRIDLAGALLGALGLASTTYGLIEQSWAVGLIGLLALVVFVITEAKVAHPMLPPAIFRSEQFSAANVMTFFMYGGLGIVFFLTGLVLQDAMGYSPLESGAATLPVTFIMLAFSARAGALAQRIGPRLPMTLGPLVVAAGMALMVRIEPGGSYWTVVLPAVLVFGAGLSLTVAPLTATVLAAADARHSGLASGVNNAVARVGQLIAVAAVPLLAGFSAGAVGSPGDLVSGFHRAIIMAAMLVALGGAIAFAFIRNDVLEAEVPATERRVCDREPTFHCATDATPLAPHADAPPPSSGARSI